MLRFIRSLAFYFGLILSTIVWGSIAVVTGKFLPYKRRFSFVIVTWTSMVLWWLRVTCGITHRVEGSEHLSRGPGILLFKHQSTWDALFSQTLVEPQSTVIKRTLLYIPFFGWAFWLTNPITINRSRKVSSMRKLVTIGRRKFSEGFWITLFPEGTRVETGQVGQFQSGASVLAVALGAPVFVVAHNGGHCWRLGSWLKNPGVINVKISPPISTQGKSTKEVQSEAEEWMRSAMVEIDPPPQIL